MKPSASERLDTLAKCLRHNARQHGHDVAEREKEFGIWRAYAWADVFREVSDRARGLLALGLGPEDVVAVLGRNRPHWLWAEYAIHAIRGYSLGMYQDALGREVAYLLNHAAAKLVLVEDEEQADKVLEVADDLPGLEHIVYNDSRGMRRHRDPRLMPMATLIELGRSVPEATLMASIDAGSGDDVAILCTTSGTTSQPKLAMLQNQPLLTHVEAYLRAEPRAPDDEYVSILPLPWIVEQVYVAVMPLLSRMRVNFPEDETTVMHDLREIGPTHVLFAPRVWEQMNAEIHSRILDANRLNRAVFDRLVKLGTEAIEKGERSALADAVLFNTLRDRLGLSRVKSAATGGAALGPDTFRFFRAMGVPLRQLYGQTESAGAYTIQTGKDLDFESSGVPFDDTEVRIDDPDQAGLGEIQVRHPGLFKGYYRQPEAERDILSDDGWLRSGDAGYLDGAGRLVVVDRLRDIATSSSGARFSPQYIENKLKFSPYIGECVVLGNGRPFVSALICIRYSMVAKWAEARGLGFTGYTNLAARPEIYDLLAGEVERVNGTLVETQRIARFLLLYKELDADDGELTRTRKVRRSVIDERYGNLIDALYSGQDRVAVDAEVTFEDGRTGRVRADMDIRDVLPVEAARLAAE